MIELLLLLAAQAFTPPPLEVPDGFTVEVVAAPPLVRHPLLAGFDERGRLFVAESDGRNLKKEGLLSERTRFIRMLEDTDGDGRFDKSTIFADKLVMPEGALWHEGELLAVSAPYLWRLADTDGDGKADKREKIVGTMEFDGRPNQHGPYLGPCGRLYFAGGTFGYDLVGKDGSRSGKSGTAAVFSVRQDGSDVRVEGHAGINPVEVAFSPEGEMFVTCAIFDSVGGRHDAIIHWVRGAICGPTSYGPPLLKSTGHRIPALRRWGQVAPAGLMRYRGTAFGPPFRDNLFACQFNTHKMVRTRLERHGSSFRGEDQDFLVSSSIDFHPTDVLEDADGSLLVLDTGGWLSWGCPTSRLAKPNVLGAIYRIRRKGAPGPDDPRGLEIDWDGDLVPLLDDPRPAVRDRAITTLVRRGKAEPLRGAKPARARRNAVWALSRMGAPVREFLADADPTVKQAAVRSVGTRKDAKALRALAKIVVDDAPPLRRAAATALGQIGRKEAVPALLAGLRKGDDDHLMHALIYALIEIGDPAATRAGLLDAYAAVRRGALIALDRMEGGDVTREEVSAQLNPSNPTLHETALRIILSHGEWAKELTGRIGATLDHDKPEEAALSELIRMITAFSSDPEIHDRVSGALRRESTPAATRVALFEAMERAPLDRLPSVWVAELRWGLSHPDERVVRQAVATIRATREGDFGGALLAIAREGGRAEDLRVEALAAAAPMEAALDAPLFKFLIASLAGDKPVLLRLTAAEAIGASKLPPDYLRHLTMSVAKVGALELPILLRAYEGSWRHWVGDPLVAALAKSPGLEALSPEALERALAKYPKEAKDAAKPLFKRLRADEGERKARLTALEAKLVEGDSAAGEAVFFGNKAGCVACHRVRGRGAAVGPDLSKIGQIRARRDLLEAVVFPSSTIVNGYEPYLVKTRDGEVIDGLLARETSDAIHVVKTDRKERRIPKASVGSLRRSQLSIMPKGLDAALTPRELSDLLAYLASLK